MFVPVSEVLTYEVGKWYILWEVSYDTPLVLYPLVILDYYYLFPKNLLELSNYDVY